MVDAQNNNRMVNIDSTDFPEMSGTLEESRSFFPDLITKCRKDKRWNNAINEARKALELGKSLGVQTEGDESEAVRDLALLEWN
ncbi:hypothetical protein V6N13_117901 [Hibiscus sabdariffa]